MLALITPSAPERRRTLGDDLADQLARHCPGGYHAGGSPASEPTAWAAMALIQAGRMREARAACDWLRKNQSSDGSVGVSQKQATPSWPTGLAILAWTRWDEANSGKNRYEKNRLRAIEWGLASHGRTIERKPEIGHDTTLVGWSWASKTHSWLEPTAIFVRALTESGYADHERTREGARLVVDRLLPDGGANYGNTRVLHQFLLPHVQPTGLAMWALASQSVDDPRIAASLDYLERQLDEPLGAPSLAYALIGLAAHGRRSAIARALVAEAATRQVTGPSSYKLALLTLAANAIDAPLSHPGES